MKLSELQKKLIAAARANPPSDRVPYAFEKRITALLAARPVLDRWALWSRALWRGAVGCLAVMALLSAGSFFIPQNLSIPSRKPLLTSRYECVILLSSKRHPPRSAHENTKPVDSS